MIHEHLEAREYENEDEDRHQGDDFFPPLWFHKGAFFSLTSIRLCGADPLEPFVQGGF